MPAQSIHTASEARCTRGNALRDTGLLAGVTLERLLRDRAVRSMPRPVLVGIGLVAAGAIAALIHVGADLRAGFAGGQSGLLPSFVQAVYAEEAQPAILHSERDGEA
jgi:hypothetical protein